MPQALANVYLNDPSNKVIPTGPGRTLVFRGGHARIVTEVDMVYALRINGATIVPDPDRCDWIPVWVEKCGPFQRAVATIELPDGTKLIPPDYTSVAHLMCPPIDHGEPSNEIEVTQVVSPAPAEDAPHTSVEGEDWFTDMPLRRGPGRPRKG